AAVRSHGIRHIPENRILQGLALKASLQDNLIMGVHDQPPIGQGLWIVQDEAAGYARKLVRTFDIRPGDIEARVENLSGRNMQKAILARELAGMPQIIVDAHPTRGIDVGAAEFVYDQLTRQRATAGILLVSSDLDEILRLSDRVMVMYQGRIMAEASPQDLSSGELGLLMAGIDPNE